MCAVILLFAFIMSMVINLVERMIIHHNRQSQDTRSEETYAAESTGNPEVVK